MNVVVTSPHPNNQKWAGYEGEAVGISGQFLVIRPTHDPMGNEVGGKGRHFMADPLELKSPVDWAALR